MTIRSAHARVLEQLVAELRQKLTEYLASGAYTDYPAYRQCVGQLQGLADALKLSEEADFKLNGDNIVDR